LKESLPAEVQQVIDQHEAAGTTDDEAYVEATMAYYIKWVCRLDFPWPEHVMRSFNNLNEDMYGDGIRGAECAVFENSAHVAMVEEPDR